MEKVMAEIRILEGKQDPIRVMFNPGDYTVSSSGVFDAESAKDPFFKEAKIEDFTVKLMFDSYERHEIASSGKKTEITQSGTDVRKKTREIIKLIMPTTEGPTNKKPPVCLFSWGKFTYKGVISRIDQKFLLFLPDGTPVREELTLTFKSVMTEKEYKEYMGLEACRKTWTVKSGDRLDLIAARELKDASLWRKIAEENHIDDPLKFPQKEDIGRQIIIPD